MTVQLSQSQQVMAKYLAQDSNRSATFWESWMHQEDPTVYGNNPLNIMTGGSAVQQYINQSDPQQQNGAYNFSSPQAGATATIYWLKTQGYSDILNAPNDSVAIQDLANKHGAGFFNGTGKKGALSYSQHIAQTYRNINPQATDLLGGVNSASVASATNNYTGLAGVFESINNMEQNKSLLGMSWFGIATVLLGIAIVIIAFVGIAARKTPEIIPVMAGAMS